MLSSACFLGVNGKIARFSDTQCELSIDIVNALTLPAISMNWSQKGLQFKVSCVECAAFTARHMR